MGKPNRLVEALISAEAPPQMRAVDDWEAAYLDSIALTPQEEIQAARDWEESQKPFNLAELIANFLPGSGEVLSARDAMAGAAEFSDAIRNRDVGGIGTAGLKTSLGILGAVPVLGEIKRIAQGAPELAKAVEAGLDLSHAARMRRAEELGFLPETYYRGMADDVEEFTNSPVWVTKSAKEAGQYADRAAFEKLDLSDIELGGDDVDQLNFLDSLTPDAMKQISKDEGLTLEGQQIYPLRINPGKQLDLSDRGNNIRDIEATWNDLHGKGLLSEKWDDLDDYAKDEIIDSYEGKALFRLLENENVYDAALNKGFESVKIPDVDPFGNPSISIGVLKPSNVRSIHARFDPTKKESANLLAGIGASALLSALYADEGNN